MKFKFTRTLVVLAAVALTYTACQKSSVKTSTASTPAVNVDAIAQQIATSLYKGITGGAGGADINQGIQAPSKMVSPQTKSLNSLSPLCGYVIDTTYSQYTTVNDTNKWYSGKFHFVYGCVKSDHVNAYTVYDSLKVQDYNSKFVNDYSNMQQYNVLALDKSFKVYVFDGNIKAQISSAINATATAAAVYHAINAAYNIKAMIVDISSGTAVIKAGYATYVSSTADITPATGPSGVFINYTGNIVFLGNNMAKLTIDPKHYYTINLATGVITARN